MNLNNLRNLIIPVFVVFSLFWVFNRPIIALSLFTYKNTGAYLNFLFKQILSTKKEATNLIDAQSLSKKLLEENQKLKLNNALFKAQLGELNSLRSALFFKETFGFKTIPAQVIGRSPDTWHNQFIINKGSKDGIKVGKGVISEKGVIGQVQKIGPHSAIIQLVTNHDWRMGVKITRLDQYGILNGNYPAPAQLEFITVDSEVLKNDEIVTSGVCLDADNCPYPENFPVGKVISVQRDPNVVNLVVKVAFYADLSKTTKVFILQ